MVSLKMARKEKKLKRRSRSFNRKVERLEGACLQESVEQPDCETFHHFAPGVYLREIFMPAGSLVIGHEHRTKHFNIVTSGSARVMVGSTTIKHVKQGDIFISDPTTRKVLHIDEDMSWVTVHPTNETDVNKLENSIFKKSKTFLEVCGGIDAMNATELKEKKQEALSCQDG